MPADLRFTFLTFRAALRPLERFAERLFEPRRFPLRLRVADFFDLLLAPLGVFDRRREALLLFDLDALGVALLRLALRFREVERERLGALGVRAFREVDRREAERLLLALGVALLLLFRDVLLRDVLRLVLLFGALGALDRRREADFDLEAFGVALRRLVLRLRLVERLGALGVRAFLEADRDFDFDFLDLGVFEDRIFCFFFDGDLDSFVGVRALFFRTPISLFRFSNISCLYSSFAF